jgi:thiosulfate/3-mercaptopyruvate sulfurtransferase
MEFTTLISVAELAGQRAEGWAVVDCRVGREGASGLERYRAAHIAGAVHAHLEEDLSGPIIPGRTGRHPLPDPDALAERLGRWGIDGGTQVVAYDDRDGSMAARLWWLLRWLGHDKVAVLDGGLAAWAEAGLPLRDGVEERAPRRFIPRPRPELIADAAEVLRRAADPAYAVIDARAHSRYLGQNETLDPLAGHIPGARSYPFADNVDAAGLFRPREELRARFAPLVERRPPEHVIAYCGSGVTAAHNILAMEHAGLAGARLYVGSWSEWITDQSRPIECGEPG